MIQKILKLNIGKSIQYFIAFIVLSLCTSSFATDNYSAVEEKGEYPGYPPINYGTDAQSELLHRGEALTKLGDCIACHTTKGGKPFAGRFAIKTPFGTIYSPNITGDKETGIGKWTDEQFMKAMREGISPEGHYYYPAFPYLYFNKTTDADLKAIKAYLNAIPSVHQPNLKNSMMFPFNWRFLQLGWRILFFNQQKTGPHKEDANKSKDWNRGYYLVQGLGHCGMCHTPSYYLFSEKYSLAAPKKKYDLTGAMVEGFFAPNITSTSLQGKAFQQIADVFLKDKLVSGGQVAGPMLEVNHDSLQYVSLSDIRSIVTYLKSVKSETPPAPKFKGTGLEQGETVYNKYCMGCHSTGAGGAPKVGDVATWATLIKSGLNELYKGAINGIGGMPPKGTCVTCTNEAIQFAVDYMVSESKAGGSHHAGPPASQPVEPLTMEDGKNLYQKYCAVCHDPQANYLNTPKIGDRKAWAPRLQQGLEVLLIHTIEGYGNMPAKGACTRCNDAEIKAAVKYLLQESQTGHNYKLW